ncbi:hypothetical protein GCM10011352_33080 [Marinobacterium zhoushanense]|uniref:Uncharacterized protein n=1 Tax=Marinobacterium zhoushanense TaxID=1679163 RepID=A0ABQ1KST3_9GAMM|nr:hypothetical protein [Marinobacterium zhoushanense]GGC04244.1 hypothetical protein GCM10011352_33080 [Marinobacterium zhoushanense]
MRLIKDLVDSRIVFYWIDESDKRLSPDHATFHQAQEWWKSYMFARYEGDERRKSVIDRRSDADKRRRMEAENKLSSISPYGRRQTDVPVEVDLDLVAEKLELLKSF